MADPPPSTHDFNPTMGLELPSLEESGYEELREKRPPGLLRRFLSTQRHLFGLALGGLVDWTRTRPREERRGLKFRTLQLLSLLARPWVKRSLRKLPFPVQLRRRLEMLGPTYIKLGQVLSLRQDLLPRAVTEELGNLLNRLPAVTYLRFLDLVAQGLGRPVEELFAWIDPVPTGSASIAQSHRATTRDGQSVILKVVKPGIRRTLQTDARLLALFVRIPQLLFPQFQPRRVVGEFTRYTLREVDLRREADHAEIFAANFQDLPEVAFPRIHRSLSSNSVLCMEFFDGLRPDSTEAQQLPAEAKERIVSLGARAVIRMLYRDGFFHADLHPGNLLILDRGDRAGFIDLGMVGRLEDETRRTLLYYYYCLVTGDSGHAARYLAAVAEVGPKGDREGFRREVEEVSRRWMHRARFEDFSLGQLIMESIALGGRYRMVFPLELVLMVKALVTFEGVGHLLQPGLNVAAVSRAPISETLLHHLSPLRLAKEGLRGAPELLDVAVKAPLLITEGLRLLERSSSRPAQNPLAGIRGTLFGGFCMLAAAVLLLSADRSLLWPLAALLFVVGVSAALNRGS